MFGKSTAIFIISIVLCAGPLEMLQAAPSNGTRFPSKGKIESGYEYNVMFERPLGHSFGDLKTQDHFYTLTFGVFDWLAIDGKAGFGDVTEKGGKLPTLEYNTGFAGGYGFRIRAFAYERWGLRGIVGAQHISVHPHDRSIDNDKYEAFLDDWQVSGLVAKDFSGPKIPFKSTIYAGMKGSDCEIVYKLNKHDKKRVSSDQHIGLIVGAEIYLFGDKTRLSAEGRFIDETAFSTSLSYMF
jgi:hypothetical protein